MTAGGRTEAAEADEISRQLVALLREQWPEAADLEVVNLRRSGAGTSRENWSFDAAWTTAGDRTWRPLLLRRDPPASVVDSDRDVEYRLLLALGTTAVPTPTVVTADLSGAALERPFMILDRSPGTTDRNILTSRNPLGLEEATRLDLAHQYCDLLADVHQLDVSALGLESVLRWSPSDPAGAEIDVWDAVVATDALEPQPELAQVSCWLRDHVPAATPRTTLVHGDFRPANALVSDGRITVLLDWEFAHLGDPLEDVGWFCTPLYRREHFIPDRWQVADFLRRYSERSGVEVDPAALAFWQVLAMYKLAALALTGIRIFVEGQTDRPAAPPHRLFRSIVAASAKALQPSTEPAA